MNGMRKYKARPREIIEKALKEAEYGGSSQRNSLFGIDHGKVETGLFTDCGTSVARMKAGPVSQFWTEFHIMLGDYLSWLGYHFVDWSFNERDTLYWWWSATLQ